MSTTTNPRITFEVLINAPQSISACTCCGRLRRRQCPACGAGECPGACREGGYLVPPHVAEELRDLLHGGAR